MRPSIPLLYPTVAVLLVASAASSLPGDTPPGDAADSTAVIALAIADPGRLPADLPRDAGRRPEAILAFAGLRPGMTVLDMFSGGGYYTQLAAFVVGPAGRVVAHNNTPYAAIAGKEIEQRFADGRLAAVERLIGENNKLELPAGTFDVVLFILSYHDVYYIDGQRGWELIDRPRMLAELYSAARPGAAVVVIDHIADSETPREVVAGLHRIDPALIVADFTAAGFQFDAESDVLSNAHDPHDVIAMAPQIRGRTDRAVLRFKKPATR